MRIFNYVLMFLLAFSVFYFSGCKKEKQNSGEVSLTELLGNSKGIEITQDPYDIAPLTAVASFESSVPVNISIEIKGEIPVSHAFSEMSMGMDIPIIGLYADTTNVVEIKLTAEDGRYAVSTFEIQTDSLPVWIPQIKISTNTELRENGMVLSNIITDINGNQSINPIVFDNNGDIRWYLELCHLSKPGYPCKTLKNNLLSVAFDDYLREYNTQGENINELRLYGYHAGKDIEELPNSNLAGLVSKSGATIISSTGEIESTDDFFIEINRNSGDLLQEWDLREVMDVDRSLIGDENNGDWLGLNSICYLKTEDAYILSGKNQGIVKVDRNNDLIWLIAPHEGWGQSGWNGNGLFQCSDYLLTATDESGTAYNDEVQNGTEAAADFDWPWGQHSINLLSNGHLLIFDNGLNRNFQSDNLTYSRAVEYKIDQGNKEITQIWEYGKEIGAEFFSPDEGSVVILPSTNNRMITAGNVNYSGKHYARIIEITYPEKQIVFQADLLFSPEDGDLSKSYSSQYIQLYDAF